MIVKVLNYFLSSQEQLFPKRSIFQLYGNAPAKKHRHTKNLKKPLLKIQICPICSFTDISGSSHTRDDLPPNSHVDSKPKCTEFTFCVVFAVVGLIPSENIIESTE